MESFNQPPTPEQSVEKQLNKERPQDVLLEQARLSIESAPAPETFSLNGREYTVNTGIEKTVAEMQTKRAIFEKAHQEAIASGDYQKEKVAAKLLELVSEEEELAVRYAEMYALLGENTTSLENISSGFHTFVSEVREHDVPQTVH